MVQITAAGWYVLDQTGSASAVGVLAGLCFGPYVVGSPVGGWLADRYDIRKLASLLRLLQAIPILIMALLAWDNELSMPLLFALVFLSALPGSVCSPISDMLPPMAAPPEQRPQVLSYTATAYNMARMAGPIFGSALVVFISVGGAFLFNGLTYLLDAWFYRRVELVNYEKPAQADHEDSYLQDLKRGWAFGTARVALVASLLFFALVAPIEQLMPAVAQDHGDEIGLIGVMLAAIAVGGVVANPFIGRALENGWGNSFIIDLGMIIAGPVMLMLGVSRWLAMDLLLLFILGLAWECLWLAASASIQLKLPPDITGRMVGLFYAVVTLGTAGGAILLGLLFEASGPRWPLIAIGVFVCACGVFGVMRMRGHIHERNRRIMAAAAESD